MPTAIEVTLVKVYGDDYGISFKIQGKGQLDLDWITIDRKTKGKHKDKACWSSSTNYKARSIGDWLFRLWDFGFDTTEFEQACIDMGWKEEVEAWHNEQDDLAEKESGDGEYK